MDNFKKQLYKYAGERLRRARMVKGLSQTELSQMVGYSDSSTIYKIERGLQKIPNSKMRLICNALDIDYKYLTDGFEFTIDDDGHPVIIENHVTDDRRAELMTRANNLLMRASETQLEQIVGIMDVIIGGANDGNGNMEQ